MTCLYNRRKFKTFAKSPSAIFHGVDKTNARNKRSINLRLFLIKQLWYQFYVYTQEDFRAFQLSFVSLVLKGQKVVQSFFNGAQTVTESENEIPIFDHQMHESCWVLRSCGTVYYYSAKDTCSSFETVDKILQSDHSNETYQAVLSCGASQHQCCTKSL